MSDPQSRTRSPSPDPRSRRPSKRRRQMLRVLQFPDGKLTTPLCCGSLLIQICKWCPKALYPKRRLQSYSRCSFCFLFRMIFLRLFADSSMAALPSSPSSIPRSIHSHLCMSGLLLLLILFAWLRPESVMVEVRYPALVREGMP